MRKYKTIIIDMKKINKARTAAMLTVGAVAAAAVGIFSIPGSGERILENSIPAIATVQSDKYVKDRTESEDGSELYYDEKNVSAAERDSKTSENTTVMPNYQDPARAKQSIKEGFSSAAKRILAFLISFDISDNRTIIASELPVLKTVSSGPLAVMANGDAVSAYNPEGADMGRGQAEPDTAGNGSYPIQAIDSSQGKALGKGKILIRNETNYGIDINEMLSSNLKFDMKGEGPKVLILHTHATEAYSAEGATLYSADKSDRSLSEEENVIKIGDVITDELKKAGIEVLHDKTLHDYPNFNGSYANSLKTVEKYKAQYPSIRIVLDVHRDAFVADDGTKAKFVTDTENGKAAQLMLVVGTDAGGLEHENWRENMKLALKLQQYISEKYPTLMRGVNLRRERFNGHTTLGSMIIEVGASGNSMSEAELGARCAAQRIGEYLAKLEK